MGIIKTFDKIYVSESKIKNAGRGVFALKNIKKGEIIEICPFIDIPVNKSLDQGQQSLLSYIFFYGDNKAAIVLGFGSIYNHSDNPNAKYKIIERDKTIKFIAVQDIKKDKEITFNYKGNNGNNPLWFE